MTNYRIIHETNDTMYVFVPLLKMTGNGVVKRVRRQRLSRILDEKPSPTARGMLATPRHCTKMVSFTKAIVLARFY